MQDQKRAMLQKQMSRKYENQCTICFVGISSKIGRTGVLEPLAKESLTGSIVAQVQEAILGKVRERRFVCDNLVRAAPTSNGRMRYPTEEEFGQEWHAFEKRLLEAESKVVVLLGNLVSDFFSTRRQIRRIPSNSIDGRLVKWIGVDVDGLIVIAAAHPSYVGIYARKRVAEYADRICRGISSAMKNA